MIKCRMCSQRMTGPGRICRECDRELERSRAAGACADEVAAMAPAQEEARMIQTTRSTGVLARLHTRGSIIAAVFIVGAAGITVLHLMERMNVPPVPSSVMLDRDLSSVRPRVFMPTAAQPIPDAPIETAGTPLREKEISEPPAAPLPADFRPHEPAARRTRPPVQATSSPAPGDEGQVAQVRAEKTRAPAPSAATTADAPPAYDRVLAFSDALARCGDETFFARIACEERARMRYCDGAALQLPQCAGELSRDHGQ